MDTHFSCYVRQENRRPIVALEGTLDMVTAARAGEHLRRYLQEIGPNLLVDVSRLDFIDSKGLGVLIGVAKDARDVGGHLGLQNPTMPVQKILELTGLASIFAPQPPAATATDGKAASDGKPAADTKAAAPSADAPAPARRPRTTTRKAGTEV
jgi:anti-sigma B factor antagonist